MYLYLADGADSTRSMQPSLAACGAVLLFGVPTATGRFEKFRLSGRYVDVEQVGCGVLDAIAGRVAIGSLDPNDIKTIIGVRDAIALHGASTLRTWQERTLLTDQVANVGGSSVGRPSPVATRAVRPHLGSWRRSELRRSGGPGAVGRSRVVGRGQSPVGEHRRPEVDALAGRSTRRQAAGTAGRIPRGADRPHGGVDRRGGRDCSSEILGLVDEHVDGADTRPARFALHLRTTPDSSSEHP